MESFIRLPVKLGCCCSAIQCRVLTLRAGLCSLVVSGSLAASCQCSRGPVTETSTVVAEAENGSAEAKIVYDYLHGRQKSYDSPVWNRDLTTRETLTLFVTVPASETTKQLELRGQSNKEDHAPNASVEAELVVGPAGERVAYKLSDGDWELVFVTSSHFLFQAEPGALASAPAEDWAGVPTFREALSSVLRVHGEANGIYEEVNRGRIFSHLEQTLDEDAYVEVLAQTGALRFPLYGDWSRATTKLSKTGKAALGAKLRATLNEDPTVYVLKRALPFLDLDDPALSELIHTAPAALAAEKQHQLWTRDARNGYLQASARLDPERARATACALLDAGIEAAQLPDPLLQGCESAKAE